MRWLIYGGFVLFVLFPAILQGIQWNSALTSWNREVAWVMDFPAFEEFGDSGTGVVLLVFQWTFFTSIYAGLVVLFGGVRLFVVSWRVFGWRGWLAFIVWLGLVGCVLFYGGFLDL